MSDLADLLHAAEVAWRDVLVAESQAQQPSGCCAGPEWRSHLCQYHSGYADGVDAVLDRLRALDQLMQRSQ
jgi:hypothetical protein